MVRNKVRERENRKQIDLAKSLSSTSRSTQGWEPTGFQAKVDWISVLTGPEKDWKRSVTLQTSLYYRSLVLIEDLSDQFEEREANRREKPASKSGQVEVSLPSSCSTASSELATFFSSLVATLATKHFSSDDKVPLLLGELSNTAFSRRESVNEEISWPVGAPRLALATS